MAVWMVPAVSHARRQVDVYLHYPPVARELQERLAHAGRLYDAGQLGKAEAEAGAVARDAPELEPEARFLLARIAFSQGRHRRAAGMFEAVGLAYPESDVVRSGRLAAKLEEAACRLMERMAWADAGRFLLLLEEYGPSALSRVALKQERLVRDEVAAFNAAAIGASVPLRAPLESWLNSKAAEGRSRIGACREGKDECAQRMRSRARNRCERLEGDEARRWAADFTAQVDALRREFALRLMERAQMYPLLSNLLTEQALMDGMAPSSLVPPPSPYSYTDTYTSRKQAGNLFESSYRVDVWYVVTGCGPLSPLDADVLSFEGLSPEPLLERLGRELYADAPAVGQEEEAF